MSERERHWANRCGMLPVYQGSDPQFGKNFSGYVLADDTFTDDSIAAVFIDRCGALCTVRVTTPAPDHIHVVVENPKSKQDAIAAYHVVVNQMPATVSVTLEVAE